jgi:HUS1 checkpoint protein
MKFKMIIDKLRLMSDSHLSISANMEGNLRLEIATDAVKVETAFSGLVNPELVRSDSQEQPSQSAFENWEYVRVDVDIRDICKVLQCHAISPSNIICCISENYGAVFYVYVGETVPNEDHAGSISYFVPLKMD